MSVRSRGLLALSVLLMGSAGALAFVLQHDAVGAVPDLAGAAPGDEVTLRGTLKPFVPQPFTAREAAAWAGIAQHFGNHTYLLETAEPGLVVLVSSPSQASLGPTVTTGSVLLRTPHPDHSGRTLLLVAAEGLASPILFR